MSNHIQVANSPNVTQDGSFLYSKYEHEQALVQRDGVVTRERTQYTLKTDLNVPAKMGLMMVGWGGNNGSTVTASLLANRRKLTWQTKRGPKSATYFGSIMLASTTCIGICAETRRDVYIPLRNVLPVVDPNEQLVVGGWDINNANLAEAMERAQVLEPDLQRQLRDEMSKLKPLPSIYYPDFIAANQGNRANNLMAEKTKREQLERLRKDIREFREKNSLDKVMVIWTANTERYAELLKGVNDTADNLLKAIEQGHDEVSASTMFAVAAILEKCAFVNGSPQNTFVPGVVELALKHQVYIGGDDFKSGQTKIKSVLVDFLVGAGIKPLAIASYNHLGNNDGLNLDAPAQFRSKEISKRNVVDDMVDSNSLLYKPNERPDHVVVIKYVPSVGDSKRALDEYESEIFMGGRNTIAIHQVCEDSLLAAPLILDLCLLTELLTRIQIKRGTDGKYENFHSILSLLSYMLKAPLSADNKPVNSLFKQKNAIENFLRACVGLPPVNELRLEKMLI